MELNYWFSVHKQGISPNRMKEKIRTRRFAFKDTKKNRFPFFAFLHFSEGSVF